MINLIPETEIDSHLLRVLEEANGLGDKVKKLNLFIEHNPIFERLALKDQELLKQQLHYMEMYFQTLMLRVAVI